MIRSLPYNSLFLFLPVYSYIFLSIAIFPYIAVYPYISISLYIAISISIAISLSVTLPIPLFHEEEEKKKLC